MLNREKTEKTSLEDISGSAQNIVIQIINLLQRLNTLIHNILDFCHFAVTFFALAYIRAYKGANKNTLYLNIKRPFLPLFYLLSIKYRNHIRTAKIRQKKRFLLFVVIVGGAPPPGDHRPPTDCHLAEFSVDKSIQYFFRIFRLRSCSVPR